MIKKLIILLSLSAFVISCEKKSAFEKAFQVELPSDIRIVNERFSDNWNTRVFVYHGKLQCDLKSYMDLCCILGLEKVNKPNAPELILRRFSPDKIEMNWWDPPNGLVQEDDFTNVFTKGFDKPYELEGISFKTVARYHDGFVYIWKRGLK